VVVGSIYNPFNPISYMVLVGKVVFVLKRTTLPSQKKWLSVQGLPASRVGWACGSRRMGPRVASDGPAGRVGWARGWHRMGPRVASDGPAGRVGWACGTRRMHPAGPVPRVASDGPADRVGCRIIQASPTQPRATKYGHGNVQFRLVVFHCCWMPFGIGGNGQKH
jgi:hypothetical protein